MPIHDQSYRRYDGGRLPRGRAWAVIAGAGLRSFLARRACVALLLLAWLPFVVRSVQIYASANFPRLAFIAPTAETFRDFLRQQDVFVFFVAVYVGAGLIANDRRANALQIYLSKPLTRMEYVFGKLAVLATFLLSVTLAPALVLLLVQVSFAGSFEFVRANLHLVPAIVLLSLVEAVVVSVAMLALSSLSNSARFVAILYAGLIFFSDALYAVMRGLSGGTSVAWVSVSNNLAQLGDVLFRMPPRFDVPLPVSLGVLAALTAVSALVLGRRVRAVDVVS